MFEFDNYEKLVLMAYHQKRADGSLPMGLIHLTPASLRDECLRACRDRFLKKDEKAIRDFFVEGSSSQTCLEIIEQCDIDKFRQIIKYLKKGGALNTKEKNILLLAWLIDFEDRPYVYGKKYGTALEDGLRKGDEVKDKDCPESESIIEGSRFSAERKSDIGEHFEDGIKGGKPKESDMAFTMPEKTQQVAISNIGEVLKTVTRPASAVQKEKSKLRILRSLAVGILLFVIVGGGYAWWDTKQGTDGGCMYWADDHYQPIPCNEKVPNKMVIALDSGKVKNFRKITTPDTITRNAKGWVWYSKINNEYEYFTAPGKHPVVYNKPLKPISDWIIDKYIHPDTISRQ